MPSRPSKPLTRYRKGLGAEGVARVWLRLKGYRILESRYKTPMGEIDVIARKGPTLVFVEVKARGDAVSASLAISEAQKGRIQRAAGAYVARHPGLAGLDQRFDALFILPWRFPVHILSAWEAKTRLN